MSSVLRIAAGLLAASTLAVSAVFAQAAPAKKKRSIPVAVVTIAKGSVKRVSKGKEENLGAEEILFEDDTVSTGGDGQAQIHFLNGAIMRIRENTEVNMTFVEFSREENTTLLTLRRGSLRARIKRLSPTTVWRTATPGGIVGARGGQKTDIFGVGGARSENDAEYYLHYDPTNNTLRAAVAAGGVAFGRLDPPKADVNIDDADQVLSWGVGAERIRTNFEVGFGIAGLTDGNPTPFTELSLEEFDRLPIEEFSNADLIRLMSPLLDLLALTVPGAVGGIGEVTGTEETETDSLDAVGGGPGAPPSGGALTPPLDSAQPGEVQDSAPTTPGTQAGPISLDDFDTVDESFETGAVNLETDDLNPSQISGP